MTQDRLTKTACSKLEKELVRSARPVWETLSPEDRKACETHADSYRKFLSDAKTEREAVQTIERMAREHGFTPAGERAGEKRTIFWTFRGKAAAIARVGGPVRDGLRIIASHIDAPRLDLKQNPLYEDLSLAYLKTHYYGGIKKYHWLSRPLAMHGIVVRGDGSEVSIRFGEAPQEPVLVINDLLPHLAHKVQAEKKLSEAFPAEKLNVLVGGLPILGPDDLKEAVKLGILKLLRDRYGLVEEDFVSAEIEIVPAGDARDVGFDGAFVGGYGQDDRSCAHASLKALLDIENPPKTSIALFLDKEEIGSDGNTGAKSRFFELVLYDLLRMEGSPADPYELLKALTASKAISADVTAGIDPDFQDVHEKRNDARIGYGICLTKYTGSRGKAGANDAHAEYIGWLRRVWNRAGVIWQAGELGKVDEGGGGTVAKYLAFHGLDIVDAGTPLLSMHSPFEIAHKGDLFMTYRAYKAFYLGE